MATITFDQKPLAFKIDNFAMFKIASAGVTLANLLIGKEADADKFCAARAAVLGTEYDGDPRKFMARFSTFAGINDVVLAQCESDGIIKPISAAKKNTKRK